MESEFFNESFNGTGPYPERLTAGPNRIPTGFDQAEWQIVGNAGSDSAHNLAWGVDVIEVRNEGTGVKYDSISQYTRAGSFTQRIEIKNLELGGPIVGVMQVLNLFNTIVGGGDNQLVIQNSGGTGGATWEAFILNQSAVEGSVFDITAGTQNVAVETWFDEPSRTVRYFYDYDTTDSQPAEHVATSIFSGIIDECHRDQILAFTSNGSPGAAYANADLDSWFYKTIATVPGDYDGNGRANGSDFFVWQRQNGQTGQGFSADGNGDNVVDRFDMDIWQASMTLEMVSSPSAAATATPEPASATLRLVATAWCAVCRTNQSWECCHAS